MCSLCDIEIANDANRPQRISAVTFDAQIAADLPAAIGVYNKAARTATDYLDLRAIVHLLSVNLDWPREYCVVIAGRIQERRQQQLAEQVAMVELVQEARQRGDL